MADVFTSAEKEIVLTAQRLHDQGVQDVVSYNLLKEIVRDVGPEVAPGLGSFIVALQRLINKEVIEELPKKYKRARTRYRLTPKGMTLRIRGKY